MGVKASIPWSAPSGFPARLEKTRAAKNAVCRRAGAIRPSRQRAIFAETNTTDVSSSTAAPQFTKPSMAPAPPLLWAPPAKSTGAQSLGSRESVAVFSLLGASAPRRGPAALPGLAWKEWAGWGGEGGPFQVQCTHTMPLSTRPPPSAVAEAATFAAAVALEIHKLPQRRVAFATGSMHSEAAEAQASKTTPHTVQQSDQSGLLERRLQLCNTFEPSLTLPSSCVCCLALCCSAALASSELQQPHLVLQLCQSLPQDLLCDFPPSLLLLLHEWQQKQQQQQQQQGGTECTSLLVALATALRKRCGVADGLLPSNSPSESAAEITARQAAASAAADFAVAALEAQTTILIRLREALLEPFLGVRQSSHCSSFAVQEAARRAAGLLRFGTLAKEAAAEEEIQELVQQLRGRASRCSCLRVSSGGCSLLSAVLDAALQARVLLLHPQIMPLVVELTAAAADVSALFHYSSSEISTKAAADADFAAAFSPLSNEQLLSAGRQLRAAALQLFPPACFVLQQEQEDALLGSFPPLLEAPKANNSGMPSTFPSPRLLGGSMTDRQDAWLDLLQQLLLLLPKGRSRLRWLVAVNLDGLLLHLLLQSPLPLSRPLLLPVLLDACGAQEELQEQQQRVPLERMAYVAAAAGALADGLRMAAALNCLQVLTDSGSLCFDAASLPPSGNFSSSKSLRLHSPGSEELPQVCLFKHMAETLGSKRMLRTAEDASAEVLQLLLLLEDLPDGAAVSDGDSRSRMRITQLQDSLLALIQHTTALAAAATAPHATDAPHATAASERAGTSPAAGEISPVSCSSCCEVGRHVFGALLLLACPRQGVAERVCSLLCSKGSRRLFLLLQPDCFAEALTLLGEIPRRFVRNAALLLLQQPPRVQQQPSHVAAACLMDAYEPSVFEESSRKLQREGGQVGPLLHQLPWHKLLLQQRLFSVSQQQRQDAAAALRAMLQLPPSPNADPVGKALTLWQQISREDELKLRIQGLKWEEEEVRLLCAAAANSRLCSSTRVQSLHTLQVYVHSSVAEARPFLRRLCSSLLLSRAGLPSAVAAAPPLPPAAAASWESADSPFLLSLLQCLLHASQRSLQQAPLIAAVARVLALPLLLLPPGEAVLHSVIAVYRQLLGDALLLQCLCGEASASCSCLQLQALLLFHPQQSLLLPHRVCSLGSQLEGVLSGETLPPQEASCLLLPAWLSLRLDLPLPCRVISAPTAAQEAWECRRHDAAFLVTRHLAEAPAAALEAAAAYLVLSSPSDMSCLTAVAAGQTALTRQAAHRLLLPAYPELGELLSILCSPPLPALRQSRAKSASPLLPLLPSLAPPPEAAAASSSLPSDFETYAEALQCCRKIVTALQLPRDATLTACCLLERRQDRQACMQLPTPHTADCHCYKALSTSVEAGFCALAVAVRRYVYPFLQMLAQQTAERTLEAQEAEEAGGIAAPVRTGDFRRDIDLLLLGTQLLSELLPLAAAVALPPNNINTNNSSSSSSSARGASQQCCCCCSGWLALSDVSQFCGSLLGVSTHLPLLRRAALKFAALTLRHSLPPLTSSGSNSSTSTSSSKLFLSEPADELWTLHPAAPFSCFGGTHSSVLLQLQLQQLLHLHSHLFTEGLAPLQEQQPLADALMALRACVRHNAFAGVAAAAAEAAADCGGGLSTSACVRFEQQQEQPQEEQQVQLLETQATLLLGYLDSPHPEVRLAAWRCLESCLRSADSLLQRLQQRQSSGSGRQLLMRLYSCISRAACDRVLEREGLLPGGFCSSCPSSLAEQADALACLSTLSSSHQGMDAATALKGLTAALDLTCFAAKTHATPILRRLQQQMPQAADSNADTRNAATADTLCRGNRSSTFLIGLVDAVRPQRLRMKTPSTDTAAANEEANQAAAAAVAAVGTKGAPEAFAEAAAKVAFLYLPSPPPSLAEIAKCCRALRVLLDIGEATNAISLCLGSSSNSTIHAGGAGGGNLCCSVSASSPAAIAPSERPFAFLHDERTRHSRSRAGSAASPVEAFCDAPPTNCAACCSAAAWRDVSAVRTLQGKAPNTSTTAAATAAAAAEMQKGAQSLWTAPCLCCAAPFPARAADKPSGEDREAFTSPAGDQPLAAAAPFTTPATPQPSQPVLQKRRPTV
ncbi:uncharacterized protein LOC113146701 [Cyclospora cayetanensis]|uniref:Uncharacterized protein LOC113146701 n=1 Tax=Cyclospora cayetanensis TaxID=88456 RepID=A0A6P6RSW7_9EIME|nr:uncharacterized protein LOC113146701 [Cyclospora cayetanensis]